MQIGMAVARTGDTGRVWRLAPGQFLLGLLLVTWLCIAGAAGVSRAVGEEDLLPPERAFRFAARQLDEHAIEVHFDIADGYHLYRERFAFAARPAGVKLGTPVLPPGQVKYDEAFGKEMEIYHGGVKIRVPVEVTPADGEWTLVVTSQGCADKGICYPPMESVYKVGGSPLGGLFDKREGGTPMAMLVPPTAVTSPGAGEYQGGHAIPEIVPHGDDGDRIIRALTSHQLGAIALLFLGFGLLLTVTSSVLPMVPILWSIVVGEHVTRSRALIISLDYVLGLAVAYAGVGMATGWLGERVLTGLQTPWALGAFATLLVALALSMFGLRALLRQPRSTTSARQLDRRAAAALGAMSALAVARIMPAPLSSTLAYLARTGDAMTGGGALFALAIGMGVSLVLAGVAAGNLPPRAGHWLEVTKRCLGFLLLGEAIWVITPLLPPWAVMATWAALLLIAAVFLGAFDSLGPKPHGVARLGKGLGLIAALAGTILLVGLASGGRDLLQPLSHLRTRQSSPATAADHAVVHFARIRSVAELDARLAQAVAARKPVLLDFYADWCVSCKEMETTFNDPRVQTELAGVVVLRADVTQNNADDKALLKRFGLFGPPGIILFGADGRESPVRVIGYQSASRFLDSLERAFGKEGRP
ncbi:Thiol:disulfide interchange protein DsbD [Cupriavidus laharis]|uniref:Thiol:disulfide interchange protein DsbD n=2 Tax=Cupriavidus laharis TaxID=151654 RepID=A0ABM8XWR9_9BURK|nr:protein-disulfide reductase DsbD [Cupriavidus laharis]CAG9184811.1 Thiol:disulfide interchange protein DsbD [Cupriavidus laharis]